MKISSKEIESVEDIGSLEGSPVKMIRLKGGFHIAVGKKKSNGADESLSMGSHPAIVKYNLEKEYRNYAPSLTKSEGEVEFITDKHSHFLSESLRESGHDIYSIQSGSEVSFVITKHSHQIPNGLSKGEMTSKSLIITDLDIDPIFAKAIAGATLEKAIFCKVGLKLRK